MPTHTNPEKNHKNLKTAGLVLMVLFFIILALFGLRSCVPAEQVVKNPMSLVMDESAVEGGWDEIDTDEIVENLNRKVEAGMINIAMNTSPIFGSKIEKAMLDVALPAGTYECTAMFHNMDPETGASLGCAGAVITITVQR